MTKHSVHVMWIRPMHYITEVARPIILTMTLYSRKFSLVQNFADLPITCPEEIFVILIIAFALNRDHTKHISIQASLFFFS